MKILKKGKRFIAYRDENDINNSLIDNRIIIGDSLGSVGIDSEKFIGNTVCLSVLMKHLSDYKKDGYLTPKQELVNHSLKRIKEDIEMGDLTAIDELLNIVPIKYLKSFI